MSETNVNGSTDLDKLVQYQLLLRHVIVRLTVFWYEHAVSQLIG